MLRTQQNKQTSQNSVSDEVLVKVCRPEEKQTNKRTKEEVRAWCAVSEGRRFLMNAVDKLE